MRKFQLIQTNDNLDFGNQDLICIKTGYYNKEENSVLDSGSIIEIIRSMSISQCFEIEVPILADMIEACIIDYKFGTMNNHELKLLHDCLTEYSHRLNLDYKELRCPDLAAIILELCLNHDVLDFYNKIKIINIKDEMLNYKLYMFNNFECKY